MLKNLLFPALFFLSFAHALSAAEFETVQFPNGYTTIIIRGEIMRGDDDKFYEIARTIRRASVVLESPGGNLQAGLAIAAEVAIRDYATLVLDGEGCFSACALIWVAANRRYMSPEALIGVHAAYYLVEFNDGEIEIGFPVTSGAGNADIGAFLNEVGLDREAIRYFTTAQPDEYLPITPDIARHLNIDVRIQDGFQITFETERPTPRSISARATRLALYGKTCQQPLNFDPVDIATQAQGILDAAILEFGEETFLRLNLQHIESYLRDVDQVGMFRWCLDSYGYLLEINERTGVSGPSFDCARAATDSERTICSTPLLWGYDRVVVDIYGYLRRNVGADQALILRSEQANWLSRRQRCGGNVECNLNHYLARLHELGA